MALQRLNRFRVLHDIGRGKHFPKCSVEVLGVKAPWWFHSCIRDAGTPWTFGYPPTCCCSTVTLHWRREDSGTHQAHPWLLKFIYLFFLSGPVSPLNLPLAGPVRRAKSRLGLYFFQQHSLPLQLWCELAWSLSPWGFLTPLCRKQRKDVAP